MKIWAGSATSKHRGGSGETTVPNLYSRDTKKDRNEVDPQPSQCNAVSAARRTGTHARPSARPSGSFFSKRNSRKRCSRSHLESSSTALDRAVYSDVSQAACSGASQSNSEDMLSPP